MQKEHPLHSIKVKKEVIMKWKKTIAILTIIILPIAILAQTTRGTHSASASITVRIIIPPIIKDTIAIEEIINNEYETREGVMDTIKDYIPLKLEDINVETSGENYRFVMKIKDDTEEEEEEVPLFGHIDLKDENNTLIMRYPVICTACNEKETSFSIPKWNVPKKPAQATIMLSSIDKEKRITIRTNIID